MNDYLGNIQKVRAGLSSLATIVGPFSIYSDKSSLIYFNSAEMRFPKYPATLIPHQ
jgi:hypothetical protein